MFQPESDTMMLSAVEQGGVCLEPMHRLTSGCTQWQVQIAQIQREHQALKELKLSAQVNYPVVSGNYSELKPLNSIAHFFTAKRLKDAAKLVKKGTSPGIDGQTFEEWEQVVDYEAVAHMVRSGKYQPSPNRWAEIPKDKESLRTLGIPIIQDRVVQRAWLLVMEQVFERMFLPCSYG
jgi:retron-type reverse transcriptase